LIGKYSLEQLIRFWGRQPFRKKKPEAPSFTSFPGIELFDGDLRTLGAIAVYWAHAEFIITVLIGSLTNAIGKPEGIRRLERIVSFERKADAAKKLLQQKCSDRPLHLHVGRALLSKGREISAERNRVIHWMQTRHEGSTHLLRFVDPFNGTERIEDFYTMILSIWPF
jgi:hypothetical protein